MTNLVIITALHTLGTFIVGTIMWKRLTNVIAGWDIYASESKMKWDARWMFCFGIISSIFWEPTVIFCIFWNILYWIAERKYDIALHYKRESDEWKKFTHSIWYQIFMDL